MSEAELNVGTLVKMNLTGDIENKCMEAVKILNLDFNNKYHSSYRECIEDSGYRQVYIRGDDLYKIKYKSMESDGDIFQATAKDGVINFTTQYYNGGCSFNEALDYAMNNLE